MDLISREKALADDGLAEFHRYDDYSKMREYLKSLPSAFEGMTNREVVRTLFPNAPVISNNLTGTVRVLFSDEVWDSPYKGVSE